jgi:hypothetical protein
VTEKLIVSPVNAVARALRNVPAPLSAVLVTVIRAAWVVAHRTTHRIPKQKTMAWQ